MAFVVEDGTGVAGANAYIPVAYMRSYWTDRGVTFAQNDAALQVAIIYATSYVENRHRGNFKGEQQYPDTQTLAWPRQCVVDREYKLVPAGIPSKFMDGIAEYAKRSLAAGAVAGSLAPDPEGGLTVIRERTGPIETEFLPGPTPIYQPYPDADVLIREYLNASGSYAVR